VETGRVVSMSAFAQVAGPGFGPLSRASVRVNGELRSCTEEGGGFEEEGLMG
jgi:hypothetical protein